MLRKTFSNGIESTKENMVAKLMLVMLLLSSSVSATANSMYDDACAPRVAECEAGLELAEKAINAQGSLIVSQKAEISNLQRYLDEAIEIIEEKEVWYRRPEFLFVLGVVGGALLVK